MYASRHVHVCRVASATTAVLGALTDWHVVVIVSTVVPLVRTRVSAARANGQSKAGGPVAMRPRRVRLGLALQHKLLRQQLRGVFMDEHGCRDATLWSQT